VRTGALLRLMLELSPDERHRRRRIHRSGRETFPANLAAGPPASQQELSERLLVNRTIMVRLVDRLEAAGLVRRDRNPRDRRSYALVLTARGRQVLRPMEGAADRGEARLTVALRPEERRRLNELLRRLLPDLDQASRPHSPTATAS
jgi:DNA-binding MarR family transcriptional regulator